MYKTVLIIIFFSVNSFAQQGGIKTVFDFPNGGDYEIRINTTELYDTNVIYLAEGEYFVEIWNPGLELITDSIFIRPKNDNIFRYPVKVSPQYGMYKLEVKKFKREKRNSMAPFLVADLVGISALSIQYFKGWKAGKELSILKNTHDNNLGSYIPHLEYIENYNILHNSYKRIRLVYYSILGLTALSTSFTIYKNFRFKKRNKFPENPSLTSPFTNKTFDVSLNVSPIGTGLILTF
ncbi:MAG: hypothetical protein GQ574_23870 [Crocinitomix sp.]|nr:hypothetical protein [Crocinitomix sp.]